MAIQSSGKNPTRVWLSPFGYGFFTIRLCVDCFACMFHITSMLSVDYNSILYLKKQIFPLILWYNIL